MVLAGASGQTAALERIALVRTQNGWRLASLASPALSRRGLGVGREPPEGDHVQSSLGLPRR